MAAAARAATLRSGNRAGRHPRFKALGQYGPYDNSELALTNGSLLFVFPSGEQGLAHRLAEALLNGIGTYPGFGALFRVGGLTGQALESLVVETDLRDIGAASLAYRDAIAQRDTEREPDLAIVLVPHTERFETATPYYEAKAAFANLAVPTQMVTTELLGDERQFQWSVANIALAIFAKLGGVPWAVEAPAHDDDLVIGIGRADVGRNGDRRRYFGYAVTFVSNGIYRQTWSFTSTADDSVYEQRLEAAITEALTADVDRPPGRLVIHLAKRAGHREIDAAERAMKAAADCAGGLPAT